MALAITAPVSIGPFTFFMERTLDSTWSLILETL